MHRLLLVACLDAQEPTEVKYKHIRKNWNVQHLVVMGLDMSLATIHPTAAFLDVREQTNPKANLGMAKTLNR